jgi:hypothetical protein
VKNLGNSVNLFSKDNTEPSREGDLVEGVTTMAAVSGETKAGRSGESFFVAPGSPKIAD